MIAGMPREFNGQIDIAQPDAARQSRLRLQAPGVVELVVFFVIGLGQRSTAFAHVDMAGGTSRHHLAGVFDCHTGDKQTLAQRSAALDFQVTSLRAQVGMGQQVDVRHGLEQTVHGPSGQGLTDGGVHASGGEFIGD